MLAGMTVTLRITLTSFPSFVFSSPPHLNGIEHLLRHQWLVVVFDNFFLPALGELRFYPPNTEVEVAVQRIGDELARYFSRLLAI